MAKIRVYELARELKMESKVLLAKMKEMGIQVPSHQSTLTSAQIEKVRVQLQASQPAKVVVRRRRKSAESASEPASQESSSASTEESSDSPVTSVKVSASKAVKDAAAESAQATVVVKKSEKAEKSLTEEMVVKSESKGDRAVTKASEASESKGKASASEETKTEPVAVKVSKAKEPAEAIKDSEPKVNTDSLQSDHTTVQDAPVAKTGDAAQSDVRSSEDQVVAKEPLEMEQKATAPSATGSASVKAPEAEKSELRSQQEGKKEILQAENQAFADRETSEWKKKQKDVETKSESKAKKVADSDQTQSATKVVSADDDAGKDKQAGVKRKSFTAATIIRRATPEETEAIKAREEARQRTSRREDSRGVRVTGIGVSPRMGQGEGGEGSAPKKDFKSKQKPQSGATANKGGQQAPVVAGADELELYDRSSRWGAKSGDRTKDGKLGRREEEEKARPVVAPQGKKRVSMRDLLSEVSVDDELPAGLPVIPKKRRTVYTPSAQQKRKDLKRRKDLKSTNITVPRAAYRVVKIDGASIIVSELAKQLSIKAGELIKKLMAQGVMATMNQSVDYDTASLIASEYGFECKNVEKTVEDILGHDENDSRETQGRAPIITVMGHVDHGKTSILDAIRQANVAEGESGGITQHIGAYTVEKDDFNFTFLDTPGHAAFSAMRARGAQVTDIVVLVVAADDGVMPQTIEAISHAKNAGVPIIVAVNKIDKPNTNLERIYKELSEQGVQAEDWGGDIQFIKVSALKREGIDSLLEAIQLQAEMLELQAPFEGVAEGAVVEAHLDKGRGPVATIMVTKGCLSKGDYVVAGGVTGKVRAMVDHLGRELDKATPSTPVKVIGLTDVPMSGDQVHVVEDEKTGRSVAAMRKKQIEAEMAGTSSAASLDDLLGKVSSSEIPCVNVIVKADTQGSVEAIVSALDKLNSDQVKNVVVHKAVGGINESDLNLADTSTAVVLAFNVRASGQCADYAEKRGIIIKYYSVIYDLVDAVKNLMAGELPPIETEVIQGHAEVRDAISVPKVGTIAGSSVTDGKITRSSLLRLIRDEIVIYNGRIGSLRRFKDDVKEVQNGYECGISIEGYTDIKVGDVIEAYMIEKTAATLEFAEI